MLLVILLQTSPGYGKTQEMLLVAVSSSPLQLLIEVKQALISALQGMELATVQGHANLMYFVSQKCFLSIDCTVCYEYVRSVSCGILMKVNEITIVVLLR